MYKLGMDAPSRQLMQDLQQAAGVPTMHDTYAVENYDTMVVDPFDHDDSWFDDPDNAVPPPEAINFVQAARDL